MHPPHARQDFVRSNALIDSFTTSLSSVVQRAQMGAPANDSFELGFWSLRVDADEVIKEMAIQTFILNIDRCTKNHFYLLGADGRFRVIPTDLEDAFATDDRAGQRDCAAQGWPCRDAHCYLSCAATNTIYFCDRLHPQDGGALLCAGRELSLCCAGQELSVCAV